MPVHHVGEFLLGFEPRPLQARAPVLEEAARPGFALLVPELVERLLEQIGRVEPPVGRQQRLQAAASIGSETLPVRQQRLLLALDVAATLAAQAPVLGLAYFVECFSQVPHDVELVEQNRRLRRMCARRVAKRLPHVHHRQANALTLLVSRRGVEPRRVGFRTILSVKPDRAKPDQVAHHDAVGMPFLDRDFVDANRLWPRRPGFG